MVTANRKLSLLSNFSLFLLPEPIKSTIGVSLGANKSTESISGELASVSARLIQMANIELDRCMILGSYQPVSGRALPRDVKVHVLSLVVLHLDNGFTQIDLEGENTSKTD
uniref:Putative ovule protein n=1 Tax=Solanum chacoense TaxID=4108 RepID=A0A0V0GWR8_SOLCH